ncbi:MAG: hypothetical protein ACLQAH_13950 [Limisphaerales bacterium]
MFTIGTGVGWIGVWLCAKHQPQRVEMLWGISAFQSAAFAKLLRPVPPGGTQPRSEGSASHSAFGIAPLQVSP